jgi:serine phosphatase RsbU (regulator of sigma subunit)/CHASE2 domain-containing sensor protein
VTSATPVTPALRTSRIRAIGGALLIALAIAIAVDAGRFSPLRETWFDALQRISPRPVEELPATIVAIDERSLAAVGRWPWPRSRLAELVAKAAAHGARAIGVDVVLPETDALSPERLLHDVTDDALRAWLAGVRPYDDVLADALQRAPTVLAMVGSDEPTAQPLRAAPVLVSDAGHDAASASRATSRLLAFPAALSSIALLTNAAHGWGLISAEDVQGVVRRVPLVANINGTLVPGFGVELWRVAAGQRSIRLVTRDGEASSVSIGGDAFPADTEGMARPWFSLPTPERFVSAVDVLNGTVDTRMLQHTFVLIGVTGLALGDYVWTPVAKMPGVEAHAQLLENMHLHTFLRRPAHADLLEALALLVVGATVIVAVSTWRVAAVALVALFGVAIVAALSWLAFDMQRLLLDAATPLVAFAAMFALLLGLQVAETTRQRKALQNVLQREREAAARVAGEMEAARRIQLDSLPRADVVADRRLEIAASMEPALEVGGDLYDFYRLDDDRLFFMVGDVAGKGLSASIFMAVSKALCKSAMLRASNADLGAWLTQANREVARDNPGALFVTLFAGVLDLARGELAYCNAGHENPWWRHAAEDSVTRLAEGGGPPLCVVEDFDYGAALVTLSPGDLLCVVTDGVTEARDPAGVLYGTARVVPVLARTPSAKDVVQALRDDVQRFAHGVGQADDLTVLSIRWLDAQAGEAS